MFTYIQPLLAQVSGFTQAAVSPVLLVFGVGMIVGNLLGGRLADRRLAGSLAALVLVLRAMGLVLHNRTAMVVFVGLLGVAAFATVAPLQLRVLEHARGTGQNLASSRNIAAFNLGNALGGVAGRDGIATRAGLVATLWVAALPTAVGLGIALWSVHLQRRRAHRPGAGLPAQ